ncbi:UvrD-helicase domain-containing protein, partial [Klebsiella pneumoniae]|uniref:UvrD-helicase domain-containing protein n=1 Tax=Klebsiella pneumoniae TaxID=573 RepID=UPI0039C3F905
DDDQSIYAFRGARVGNMADFEREYRVKHSSRSSGRHLTGGRVAVLLRRSLLLMTLNLPFRPTVSTVWGVGASR